MAAQTLEQLNPLTLSSTTLPMPSGLGFKQGSGYWGLGFQGLGLTIKTGRDPAQ